LKIPDRQSGIEAVSAAVNAVIGAPRGARRGPQDRGHHRFALFGAPSPPSRGRVGNGLSVAHAEGNDGGLTSLSPHYTKLQQSSDASRIAATIALGLFDIAGFA